MAAKARRMVRQEQEQAREAERRTLALLTDMARQEAHRVAGVARHAIDASDAATDAWLRLADRDAATLATLTDGGARIDDAAMADAARRARMVVRSVIGTAARSLTIDATAEAPATAPTMAEALAQSAAPCPVCQEADADAERLTCDAARMADRRQERGTVAWHATHAAFLADGPAQRGDRDAARGYAARDGGRRAALAAVADGAAWDDGAAIDGGAVDGAGKGRKRGARTMGRKLAERTMGGPAHDAKGTVRLLREAPLASLLSDAMRTHGTRNIDHGAAIDRVWRSAWMRTADAALRADRVGGRAKSARLALAEALRRAEADADWRRRHGATLAQRADLLTAEAEAREALAQSYRSGSGAASRSTGPTILRTADGAPRSATTAERRAANAAALRASEAAHGAAMACAVWDVATAGGRRPLRLLRALLASVDVAQWDAADRRSVASVIDWRTLALAIGADASKRGQEALRDFVRDAVGSMVVSDGGRQRAALLAAHGAAEAGAAQREAEAERRLLALADGALAIVRQAEAAQRAEHADAIDAARRTFRGQHAHRVARHAARMA